MTLRHTGSMGIRRLTAGGGRGIRMKMSTVVATRLGASTTDSAATITGSCAKRIQVSCKRAVLHQSEVYLQSKWLERQYGEMIVHI